MQVAKFCVSQGLSFGRPRPLQVQGGKDVPLTPHFGLWSLMHQSIMMVFGPFWCSKDQAEHCSVPMAGLHSTEVWAADCPQVAADTMFCSWAMSYSWVSLSHAAADC